MSGRKFGRTVPPHARLPVAWYQFGVLWTAVRDVLSSLDQLRNRDLRESYALPMTVIDRSRLDTNGEFWFDFIADTGDGGNATYAVASAALKDDLVLPLPEGGTARLPRGELLLLGGDLAYPGASSAEYRYRFVEMFEAVRNSSAPTLVRGRPMTLAALAQNHDWMDSASTFSRYFLRRSDSAPLLGAQIPQRQSYFCVRLPQGWWALGMDFALLGDIDRDQFEQFEALLSTAGLTQEVDGLPTTYRIGAQDSVMLVYPEPYWTRPILDGADPGNPKRYQRLEGLLGERIRFRLAGDLHHYMRWQNDAHGLLVTCGTGGAFTHPTHTLPTTQPIGVVRFNADDRIPPEPRNSVAVAIGRTGGRKSDADPNHFVRQEETVYPDPGTSCARAIHNPCALLGRQHGVWGGNQTFAVLLGVLYWLNAYVTGTPFHDSFMPDGFRAMWRMTPDDYGPQVMWLWIKAMVFSPLGMIINSLMLAACVAMGREAAAELAPGSGRVKRWIWTILMGLLHGLLHAFAVFTLHFWLQVGATSLLHLDRGATEHPLLVLHSLAVGGGMLLGGAVFGALLFGCYLALMSRAGLLTNNGYSALGIQDFKGFLRFRVAADGRLDASFVALDAVPRRWYPVGRAGEPIWAPGEPLTPRVHDRFSFAPRRTGPGAADS